jgi:hypothetical protein
MQVCAGRFGTARCDACKSSSEGKTLGLAVAKDESTWLRSRRKPSDGLHTRGCSSYFLFLGLHTRGCSCYFLFLGLHTRGCSCYFLFLGLHTRGCSCYDAVFHSIKFCAVQSPNSKPLSQPPSILLCLFDPINISFAAFLSTPENKICRFIRCHLTPRKLQLHVGGVWVCCA